MGGDGYHGKSGVLLLARMMHRFSSRSDESAALTALLTTIGRSFRNKAETLRTMGGTSGVWYQDMVYNVFQDIVYA